jgi:hypothetical protein
MPVRPPNAVPNPALAMALQLPANNTIYSVGSTINLEASITSSLAVQSHSFLANGVPAGTGVTDIIVTDIIGNIYQASWTPGTAGEVFSK